MVYLNIVFHVLQMEDHEHLLVIRSAKLLTNCDWKSLGVHICWRKMTNEYFIILMLYML